MMKLNKRIKRNIKHKLSFYISGTILTMMSIVFFLSMLSAGKVLTSNFNGLLNDLVVEDGEFTTYKTIDDDGISNLEKDYDVVLERNSYINCEEDDFTIRAFEPTSKVNIYKVLDGNDISSDNDIVLSFGFSKANALHIGDSIKLKGKEFKITGFFARPDYLYMLENTTDAYKNDECFGIAVVSKKSFNELGESVPVYYVKYNKDNEETFRKHIYEQYVTLSYQTHDSNKRISYVDETPKMYVDFSYVLMPMVLVFVVLLISIVLGRTLKHEQRQIGTLSALGYRKKEIIGHYVIYAAIPGIIGGILGVILSAAVIQPVCEYVATDFEPIPLNYKLDVPAAIVSMIIPIVVYIISGCFVVSKMLKKNTIDMLNNNAAFKKKNSKFLNNTKIGFKPKYILRTIINNKSRFFVSWLGVTFGAVIILIGFIFSDTCNNFVSDGMNDIGSFEYQYIFKSIQSETNVDAEKAIMVTMNEKSTMKDISFYGVDTGEFFNTETESGKEFEAGDKFYITRAFADKFNYKVGDTITINSSASMEEKEIEVYDIIKNNTQAIIFTGRENACELVGLDNNCFNALISKDELDIDSEQLQIVNTKQKVRDQIKVAISTIQNLVYVLYFFGAILCITSIYITTNMLIEENKINISMLKVLGYRNYEINRLIMAVNYVVLPLGIVCSIPSGLALTKSIFTELDLDMNINVVIKPISILSCVLIVGLTYVLCVNILKRKTLNVNMVESLKDTRE